MDLNEHKDSEGKEVEYNSDNISGTFLWHVPKLGRKHKCIFFEPDSLDEDSTMLFEVSFFHARSASNNQNQAACYFGSALCAFCPQLTPAVKNALEQHGIELSVVKLPSEADNFGIDLDDTFRYDPLEIYTLFGSCIMVLKLPVIDEYFVSNTVFSLGSYLGMQEEKIRVCGSHFLPVDAKAVWNVFGTSWTLIQEIVNFLTWLSNRKEKNGVMAYYVLNFLHLPIYPLFYVPFFITS